MATPFAPDGYTLLWLGLHHPGERVLSFHSQIDGGKVMPFLCSKLSMIYYYIIAVRIHVFRIFLLYHGPHFFDFSV